MQIFRIILIVILACAGYSVPLGATTFKQPPQRAEVKLAYGPNEVKVGASVFQIIRAQVATLSASDFDTFTVYLQPEKNDEPWLHVTLPAAKGEAYYLRNYETADANTQAIAFYRNGNRLYAVQATKIGPVADTAGSAKTAFDFKVFVFNGNDEVPMFANDGAMKTKKQYVNAQEALEHEFFKP